MSFDVAAEAYDRFMGVYSVQLAPQLADFAGITRGQRVLDVGCGPGALTAELVARLGSDAVAAVDPSESFVAAARERHPGVAVGLAVAESLPFDDGAFDAALAQLVVHFMSDPVLALREMARVTGGGTVAACTWDLAGGRSPLGVLWAAERERDAGQRGEADRPGAREGHLASLFREAGLSDIEESTLSASVEYASFAQWWAMFELGVGPAGRHVASLDDDARADLRERCRRKLGDGPFTVGGQAFAVRTA